MARTASGFVLSVVFVAAIAAAGQRAGMSADGAKIANVLGQLRGMSDSDRATATLKLALSIRVLPAGNEKVQLANGLANLATEGDFGKGTLQAVTSTLDRALAETPQQPERGEPAFAYTELASLARYEHMKVALDTPAYLAAMTKLDFVDDARRKADFTLQDLQGHAWTLSSLKGKIVLVNFWATWCPPCRKEMPDLETLYARFKDRGLVILGISDEKFETVNSFISGHRYTYPILLDPGRKINDLYKVDGIPKTFIYDREGHLAAQAMDMRTMNQFLSLLSTAGMK